MCCLVTKSCWTLVGLWTVVHQTPLSLGLPRQECQSGLPFPSPMDLPNPGIKPTSPALAGDSLPLSHHGKWKVKVAQSCLTLCNPITHTVHGILQARILEWVAFPFYRGSSQPRIEPRFPILQVDSLPAKPQGKGRPQVKLH